MSSSAGFTGYRFLQVYEQFEHPTVSSHWMWWGSHGQTTTWRCSCCRMRSSWLGGTGGWCPTTRQGQTLEAMVAPCFDRLLGHWPLSQGCETSIPAKQIEFKLLLVLSKKVKSCLCITGCLVVVVLLDLVPSGDRHHWGESWWLHYLQVLRDELAAMWCNGARQGLLSALDYKRGCAILLPNTTRRRGRNKVVNVAIIDRQLLLLSIMFVHRVKRIC